MSTPDSSEITCPTEAGLSTGGFQPGFSWHSLIENPKGNWHAIGWLVSAFFILVTWIVSLIVVTKHLKNYYEPQIQRHKLRVLLFPPVYATLAWVAYLRYDYATTIMFFATVFEAFAVFNLFNTLQAYLEPFRVEAGALKEPKDTKIMFMFKLHLKSMWGMHYRVITDILVFQYPIWSLIDSFLSIFAELKGRYCEGVYSFKGAYVYLTIINFISLSVILTALFTYLDVFHREWLRGKINAHGMFWCVKGPIMINFYLGEILLSILSTVGVIKGTDGSNGSIAWPTDAVKNGIYVIIVCFVMMIDSFMMLRFFSPKDNVQNSAKTGQVNKMTPWKAFVDGYLAYIPEFFRMIFFCCFDSSKLMKKRKDMKKRKNLEELNGNDNNVSNNSYATDHLLDHRKNSSSEYRMNELGVASTGAVPPALPQQQDYHNYQQQPLYHDPSKTYSQTQSNYHQQELYPPQQYNQPQHPF